jgi:hypothetical protein
MDSAARLLSSLDFQGVNDILDIYSLKLRNTVLGDQSL